MAGRLPPIQAVARLALYATIVATPWLYRGPAAIAVAIVSVASGLCLTIAALDHSARRHWRWSAPTLLIAAALMATLLQLVPMPLRMLGALSSGTTAVLGDSGMKAISLDPPATALAALQLAALLMVAMTTTMIFRHRGRAKELFAVIGLYGALLTAIGLGELVVVHEDMPRYVAVAFENANHFGAFVGFACFANVAVALGLRDNRRWLFVAGAALCLIGTLLSASRGAIGALLAAALAYGALTLVKWSRWEAARWFMPIVAVCAALGVWLLWSSIALELQPDAASLTKLDVWRFTLPMLGDFALLGIGRGAFAQAFTRYNLTGTQLRFTHVENAPLQTLVDFGPLLGSVFVLATLYCLGRAAWSARRRADWSAMAFGLGFLALHNLVDFNTALLGVGLPAAMVLTTLFRSRRRAKPPELAWMPYAAVGATAAVAVLSFPIADKRLAADTTIVREHAGAGDVALVEAAIARHPADWVLPAIAAENAIKRRDLQSAMHHINRAMLLAPYGDVPHRLAGRALLVAGRREQARIEYRLAARKVPGEMQNIITEMLRNGETLADIPLLADGVPEIALPVANVLMDRGAPLEALRALEGALTGRDVTTETLDLATRASLASADPSVTAKLADALEARDPKRPTAYLARAERAETSGDLNAALAELDRGIDQARATHDLTRRRIHILTKLKRYADAHQAITWLLEHARGAADASSAHYYRGNLFMAEGRASDALVAYRKACELTPRELSYRLALAGAYEKVGDRPSATRELERARTELGDSAAIMDALKRLRTF